MSNQLNNSIDKKTGQYIINFGRILSFLGEGELGMYYQGREGRHRFRRSFGHQRVKLHLRFAELGNLFSRDLILIKLL